MSVSGSTLTNAETAQYQLHRHIFGAVPAPLDKNGKPLPLYLAVWSGRRMDGQKDLADPTTRYYRWPEQAQAAKPTSARTY